MKTIDGALRALERELTHWPGYVLENIGRGATWGGDPYEVINLDWWYVTATTQSGPKGRGHYQGSGSTLLEAITGLRSELVSRRRNPHRWHIEDWMQEGRFVRTCRKCRSEAASLFEGKVDWDDE